MLASNPDTFTVNKIEPVHWNSDFAWNEFFEIEVVWGAAKLDGQVISCIFSVHWILLHEMMLHAMSRCQQLIFEIDGFLHQGQQSQEPIFFAFWQSFSDGLNQIIAMKVDGLFHLLLIIAGKYLGQKFAYDLCSLIITGEFKNIPESFISKKVNRKCLNAQKVGLSDFLNIFISVLEQFDYENSFFFIDICTILIAAPSIWQHIFF